MTTTVQKGSGGLAALIIAGTAGLFAYRKIDADRRASGKDPLAAAIRRRVNAFLDELAAAVESAIPDDVSERAAPHADSTAEDGDHRD